MRNVVFGALSALLTWQAVLQAFAAEGRLQDVWTLAAYAGVCLTVFWFLLPRKKRHRSVK